MKREDRYIVMKRKDVCMALSIEDRGLLKELYRKINDYRLGLGKPILMCVVVESDWPEYEPIWRMIEDRVKTTSEAEYSDFPADPYDPRN